MVWHYRVYFIWTDSVTGKVVSESVKLDISDILTEHQWVSARCCHCVGRFLENIASYSHWPSYRWNSCVKPARTQTGNTGSKRSSFKIQDGNAPRLGRKDKTGQIRTTWFTQALNWRIKFNKSRVSSYIMLIWCKWSCASIAALFCNVQDVTFCKFGNFTLMSLNKT